MLKLKVRLPKGTVTDVYSDFQFEEHHCEIVLDINKERFNTIINSIKKYTSNYW